jgi:hypothetical protein
MAETAGGSDRTLAYDMAGAEFLPADLSDRVVQVAREINSEAGRQVAIAYRGDTIDTA